jgi:hypothetical protein
MDWGAYCGDGGISGGPETVCGAVDDGLGVDDGTVDCGTGVYVGGGVLRIGVGALSNWASVGESLAWFAVNRLGFRLRRQSR